MRPCAPHSRALYHPVRQLTDLKRTLSSADIPAQQTYRLGAQAASRPPAWPVVRSDSRLAGRLSAKPLVHPLLCAFLASLARETCTCARVNAESRTFFRERGLQPPSQMLALHVYKCRQRLHVADRVYRLQTIFSCAQVNEGGGLLVCEVAGMNRTVGQPSRHARRTLVRCIPCGPLPLRLRSAEG